MQEAVLSPDTFLCCDTWSINLAVFVAATSWLLHGNSGLSEEVLTATSFIDIVRVASMPDMLTLGRILHLGIMLQCSEPRDRVFGLVSLLRLSTMRFPYPVEPVSYTHLTLPTKRIV